MDTTFWRANWLSVGGKDEGLRAETKSSLSSGASELQK